MVGGGDEHRPYASRGRRSAAARSRRSSRPKRRRSAAGRREALAAIRSGCCATTCTRSTPSVASKALTGRRTIGSPSTGISALRSVPCACAKSSLPGREPARTSAVSPLTTARRRSGRRDSRPLPPGRAGPRGTAATRSSTAPPARSPRRAVPTSNAATRITMFGLRRAVISRKRLSICSQTWMCIPKRRTKTTFDAALRDIADDDHRQHVGGIDRLQRPSVGAEPVQPRPPPEWRVHEVDAVVEDIAPPGRGAGAARELPVDGVEHHEGEAGQHARPIMAVPEQVECEHAEDRADHRHHVGRQPRLRRPARQVERRLAPQVQGQRVGDALVGRVVSRALDLLGGRVGQRQHERPLALAQLGVSHLRRRGVELFQPVEAAAFAQHRAA